MVTDRVLIQILDSLIKVMRRKSMKADRFVTVNPERYDIATEVLSSAVRVLQAVGFSEAEIPKLFEQVANKRARVPLWIEPV
jgi:DNA-binding transcriptional regulator YhcF (GntR family)